MGDTSQTDDSTDHPTTDEINQRILDAEDELRKAARNDAHTTASLSWAAMQFSNAAEIAADHPDVTDDAASDLRVLARKVRAVADGDAPESNGAVIADLCEYGLRWAINEPESFPGYSLEVEDYVERFDLSLPVA